MPLVVELVLTDCLIFGRSELGELLLAYVACDYHFGMTLPLMCWFV